jgi:hypothetical protein
MQPTVESDKLSVVQLLSFLILCSGHRKVLSLTSNPVNKGQGGAQNSS